VHLDGNRLTVVDRIIDLTTQGAAVYAVAIGKAAPAMAGALDELLGKRIKAGVISGPATANRQRPTAHSPTPERWQFFGGGHPIPNQQSLSAAQAIFKLLKGADQDRATILFLISGGGSAMVDWPLDDQVTLDDLIAANRLLIACGASIAEVNAVRRAISAVKGGRLAARAPLATQISLIISDTNTGDEASVASGPTIDPPEDAPDARAVVKQYQTLANLPHSVLEAIDSAEPRARARPAESPLRGSHVLLNNRTALEAAAGAARHYGLFTEVAFDLVETEIEEGCTLLLSRIAELRTQYKGNQRGVCLISGGEFLCPVRGQGVGGRNAETVLRCAIEIENQLRQVNVTRQIAVLSAGTDGIDGNSAAASAIADETTIQRASQLGLEPQSFETSDAFSFFKKLGDTVVTGATGTNVRDVRIFIA
jgi:hydroxypyruvate reductase